MIQDITGAVPVAASATPEFDASKGNYFTFTCPAANVTGANVKNVKPGQSIFLDITQDSVGSRTFAFAGSTMTITGVVTISATAGTGRTILQITAASHTAAAVTSNQTVV